MSRFYKTARAQFVDDKMFEIPVDLAVKAIQAQDKNVDNNIKQLDDFSKSLALENLKIDNPVVNKRLQEYKTQIDDYSKFLTKNPLDFRKKQAELGQFSRKLSTDLNRGLLGQAQNQFKDLKDFDKSLEELKEVSQERKDLTKRAVRQRYNNLGGLGFKDENTFNQIKDQFVTPLNEFNEEDFINTIAKNFIPDKTSKSGAFADGKGYIRTGHKDVEIRSEADVQKYVEDSLTDGEWEAQKRQLYELKKELGEIDSNANVDELVEQDKQNVIRRAKNKLGYQKETTRNKLASDGTFLANLRAAENNLKAGTGTILTEVRDPRKNFRKRVNSAGQDLGIEYSPEDIKSFEAMHKKVVGLLDLGNAADIVKDYYENPEGEKNIKDLKKKLATVGITHNEFVNYLNYENSIENLETPHKDGYDSQNRLDVAEQASSLNKLVSGFNNLNPNEEIKSMRISRSDGSYEELPYTSLGQLIEDDKENQFIYFPVTSVDEKNILKKNPAGSFVDSEGDPIKDPNTGESIKDLQKVRELGLEDFLVFDTTKVSGVNTTKNLIKADKANLKQNKRVILHPSGMVKKEKEYLVSNTYYRANKETGKLEAVNLDVIIDANKLKVNNQ